MKDLCTAGRVLCIWFQPRAYAAYLYDAVIIYATALDEELKAGGSAHDGESIMKRIRDRRFDSA